MTQARTVVILAAGEGKRMKSATPKALHPLLGRTLLGHVLSATQFLQPDRCVVVVGHGAEAVTSHLAGIAPHAVAALQAEQRGTGHATRIALEAAGALDGTVVVINADVPLLRPQTLDGLVNRHESSGAAATILTAEVDDPYGLGRIIRDPGTGAVESIVEERDATAEQRSLREINAGLYAFDAALLTQALGKLTAHNDQGEEYLTDVIGLLFDSGCTVAAHTAADPVEVRGCNDRAELAALRALLRDRVNVAWMRDGVSIIDPATTWIDVTATIAADAVIEPNTHVRGASHVAAGAVVGPDTTVIDTRVAEGAQVVRSHVLEARIGPRALVGPYAYLRPGTVLHEGAKVGTFVEVKNSELGAGAKVPHQSYVGDATVGPRANLGAGTIVVNYDGQRKHHTEIGEAAFIGCDTSLVAPVTVEPGAYVAAGSVITRDVSAGALAVTRAPQREIEGWVERRRPGTKAAAAAAAAKATEQTNAEPAAATAVTTAAELTTPVKATKRARAAQQPAADRPAKHSTTSTDKQNAAAKTTKRVPAGGRSRTAKPTAAADQTKAAKPKAGRSTRSTTR